MKIPGIRERRHVPLYEGFYAIIQFCPDPLLGEGVNVGVVVGGDGEPLRIRFAESNERVVWHFGPVDEASLNSSKIAFAERLKGLPCRSIFKGGREEFDALSVPAVHDLASKFVVGDARLLIDATVGGVDRAFEHFVEAPARREREWRLGTLRQPGALGLDDLVKACKNIGFDLTCGACAALFYTGYGAHEHEPGCASFEGLLTKEEAGFLVDFLSELPLDEPVFPPFWLGDIVTKLRKIANR